MNHQNEHADSAQGGLFISFRELRAHVRNLAWEHAGIVRDEAGLKKGLLMLDSIEGELKNAMWTNVRERIIKEDLLSAVFSVKAILSASMGRKESRGSFIRKDYPKEDNDNWRKNSCLTYNPQNNSFSVSYHDAEWGD
jgi:succinate dehydrogenase / fumarate reductase flavoprotein subunit